MIKKCKLIFFLFSIIFIVGCQYGIRDNDAPAWVSHRKHIKYPDAFYLIGVGVSEKDSAIADENARIDLIKQIEVQISGEQTSSQSEKSDKDNIIQKTEVESKISSKVNMNIEGLYVKEKWIDEKNKRFYSLAVLDRNIACEKLSEKIKNEIESINKLFMDAEEFAKNKDVLKAINNYTIAYTKRNEVESDLQRYNVIKGELGEKLIDRKKIVSLIEIKTRLDDLKKGIKSVSLSNETKKYSWDDGMVILTEQIISGIYDSGKIKVVVLDFIDGTKEIKTKLSNIIESELKVVLGKVDDILIIDTELGKNSSVNLKEQAKSLNAKFYLTGIYWSDNKVLRINAKLVDVERGTLVGTGRIAIQEDGVVVAAEGSSADFNGALQIQDNGAVKQKQSFALRLQNNNNPVAAEQSSANPDFSIDKLYFQEKNKDAFNIDILTNKKEYEIGDALKINFKSNKDCYLIVFDIGTSGNITMLFPNSFYKDNFIKAEKLYSIPEESWGFNIEAQGPEGIERIKAIVSDKPIVLKNVDYANGFYSIKNITNLENISSLLDSSSIEWAQSYAEIRIKEKGSKKITRTRGIISKKKDVIDDPKPQPPIDIIGTPGLK